MLAPVKRIEFEAFCKHYYLSREKFLIVKTVRCEVIKKGYWTVDFPFKIPKRLPVIKEHVPS